MIVMKTYRTQLIEQTKTTATTESAFLIYLYIFLNCNTVATVILYCLKAYPM